MLSRRRVKAAFGVPPGQRSALALTRHPDNILGG